MHGTRPNSPGSTAALLTVREAARRLGVAPFTVYKLCDRGELRSLRVLNAIRIAPADLQAFIARQRKGGAR